MSHPNLHPEITKRLDEQSRKGQVDITKLEPGTRLEVRTLNSIYLIEVVDPAKYKIVLQGGKHFTVPEPAHLHGSTWGGSMIMVGKIGHQMHMEIARPGKNLLLTSAVQSAKIIGPDWSYEMDWTN